MSPLVPLTHTKPFFFFMIFSFCEKTKHPHVFCVDFHIIVGGFTDPSDPSLLVVYRLHWLISGVLAGSMGPV